MKILWLTWKDKKHPLAGGAEVVNEELAKRLALGGHEVLFVVGGFVGGEVEETRDGFRIVRLGNRFTTYWKTYRYYKKHLRGWPDLVVDEMNTIPYFARFYVKERNIMFVHQLCRKIWFYQIIFPLSFVGYLLEPIYLWMLRKNKVITVSESTQKDLVRFGFKVENISIISEGIELEPVQDLSTIVKYDKPTVLALGSIRAMKRTGHIVKAFEIAKRSMLDLELVLAGDATDPYGQKVLQMIKESPYKDSIRYEGKVSKERKVELIQKSHILCVTSVKEGWGLVVAEANSQGTPAIVYNVDGLRDAVKNNETGLVCDQNTPQGLAEKIVQLLQNQRFYESMRNNSWKWSREINFENSHNQFKELIK